MVWEKYPLDVRESAKNSYRQMRVICQDTCVHAARDMLYFRALR